MKTKLLVTVSFLTLLAVGSVFGQARVRVDIPFPFTAAGKVLPAGEYQFSRDPNGAFIRVVGSKGESVLAQVLTRIGAAIHTTPQDTHVVFDKIGENHTLAELWIPGYDGFALSNTKEPHEHRTVNAPNPK